MADLKYSIILPVYKQEAHIAVIVDGYHKELSQSPWSYEIICVVNGRQDRSLDVCQELSRKYPNIKLAHSEQKGWGLAVRLGLKESRGEYICFTNSSRTQPDDLIKFLKCSAQNPDHVVKASRKIRESWQRKLGSLLYNLECRTFFDLSYWDINGTPKIFPRKFAELLNLTRDDDLIDLEFLVICRRRNYPLIELPVFAYKRLGGKSTTDYRTAVRLYTGALKLWLQNRKLS